MRELQGDTWSALISGVKFLCNGYLVRQIYFVIKNKIAMLSVVLVYLKLITLESPHFP